MAFCAIPIHQHLGAHPPQYTIQRVAPFHRKLSEQIVIYRNLLCKGKVQVNVIVYWGQGYGATSYPNSCMKFRTLRRAAS